MCLLGDFRSSSYAILIDQFPPLLFLPTVFEQTTPRALSPCSMPNVQSSMVVLSRCVVPNAAITLMAHSRFVMTIVPSIFIAFIIVQTTSQLQHFTIQKHCQT